MSAEGGDEPLWGRDGKELFFRLAGSLFVVPVLTANGFSAGKPVRLFEGRRYVTAADGLVGPPDYDVARDGRFLMVKPSEEELASPHLNVVLHWADELARRVPGGKGR